MDTADHNLVVAQDTVQEAENLGIVAVVEGHRTVVAVEDIALLGTAVEVVAVQKQGAVVALAQRSPTNLGQGLLHRWGDLPLNLCRQSHHFCHRPLTLQLMPLSGLQDAHSFEAQSKNWSRIL